MGIWDTIYGNAPDLTAVKSWCPTTDSFKRITPDVTAAKNVCSTACGYGSAAVTKVDGAVRDILIPNIQSKETWSKMGQLGTIVAKHATFEGVKFFTGGGAAYNIAASSIRDFSNSNRQEVVVKASPADSVRNFNGSHKHEVDVKEMEAKLSRLEKEFSEYREMHKPCKDVKSPSNTNVHSVGTRRPDDVIRVFLMKEFIGRQLCDDLMVPVAPRERAVASTGVDKIEE